eukprot:Seg2523.1 transcript_id=Seg2523.1/GoldUCD/mRNA.D3Y31 product="hypothetical protein" protein_id=Seg2523.1/GoldUCD/D3Y31
MKGLLCLLSLCLFIVCMEARSVSDVGDALKEHDMSAWKRTCAFYRWSHCPGKREVDEKVQEFAAREELFKELGEAALLNDENVVRKANNRRGIEKRHKNNSRKAYLRNLFQSIFSKRKGHQ